MSDQQPSISRTGSSGQGTAITQDALDRLEANLESTLITAINALKELILTRLAEHERRINDLNNSHDKAVEAKRLSDEAATKIQERTVTRIELDAWKQEVEKRFNIMAGSVKTWALVGTFAGSILTGVMVTVIVRMFT